MFSTNYAWGLDESRKSNRWFLEERCIWLFVKISFKGSTPCLTLNWRKQDTFHNNDKDCDIFDQKPKAFSLIYWYKKHINSIIQLYIFNDFQWWFSIIIKNKTLPWRCKDIAQAFELSQRLIYAMEKFTFEVSFCCYQKTVGKTTNDKKLY